MLFVLSSELRKVDVMIKLPASWLLEYKLPRSLCHFGQKYLKPFAELFLFDWMKLYLVMQFFSIIGSHVCKDNLAYDKFVFSPEKNKT